MQPPKLLTVDQAAQILGLNASEVIDLCKRREIIAQYQDNTGSWVMTQRAVVAYLSRTRQWQAIRKSLTHRALFVDPESRVHSLVVTTLGRKSPLEVRLCTQASEVAAAVKGFLPDCIAIRITRQHGLIAAVIEATRERPSKVILYHDLSPAQLKDIPHVEEQKNSLHVEFLINITTGVKSLVEALRMELGLKTA
jgi:hypothetical protein